MNDPWNFNRKHSVWFCKCNFFNTFFNANAPKNSICQSVFIIHKISTTCMYSKLILKIFIFQCLSETWYLSVDMQAFILLIFLLYFSVKSSKRFWRTLITCWAINTVYCAWHLYRKSLFYFLRPHPEWVYLKQTIRKKNNNTLLKVSRFFI